MLVGGTQMHWITFLFICIETVVLFYLTIYKFARPDDKTTVLNIVLIALLIFYNLTGGLLPDPKLPGSYFIQTSLAYATGFITPCYFPYYVYKAFRLTGLRFHAYKGVFLFLIFPYILFVTVFAVSGSLEQAKDILIIPVCYALWVIFSLNKAVRAKYRNDFSNPKFREERWVLLLSLTPWVGLPIIDFFNFGQAIEASITNVGFLGLFAFQLRQHITSIRVEHEKVVASEQRLKSWNSTLQTEVEKRTKELARINEQQMNTFINLAHETKTPLTLVNNYMDEYISKHGNSEELSVVKNNIDKLSADIVNLFDLEKFKKGFGVYNHNQVCDFSRTLSDSVALFKAYAEKSGVNVDATIEENIHVKADPLAINRIINNLVENAIKFSPPHGLVHVKLATAGEKIIFSVKDEGPGIPVQSQRKIFEPYYQIGKHKNNLQGMGLGLPIVKKVVEDLSGEISVFSEPDKNKGTEFRVEMCCHHLLENEAVAAQPGATPMYDTGVSMDVGDFVQIGVRKNIMIVEDNRALQSYLAKKLKDQYNIYTAFNGSHALKKLNELKLVPDLIITDVMMDHMDGYAFAAALAKNETYSHIPFVFLTAKSTSTDRLKALKLGAIDVIQKPFSFPELSHKIEAILAISEKQRKALVENVHSWINKPDLRPSNGREEILELNLDRYNLTQREKDIARAVGQGKPYKTIAETLYISEKTVAKHVQNIFDKVQVSNRLELIKKLELAE